MKKLLLGLGSVAAIVAPVATVVACGSSSGINLNPEKAKALKEFSFANDKDKTTFAAAINAAKTKAEILKVEAEVTTKYHGVSIAFNTAKTVEVRSDQTKEFETDLKLVAANVSNLKVTAKIDALKNESTITVTFNLKTATKKVGDVPALKENQNTLELHTDKNGKSVSLNGVKLQGASNDIAVYAIEEFNIEYDRVIIDAGMKPMITEKTKQLIAKQLKDEQVKDVAALKTDAKIKALKLTAQDVAAATSLINKATVLKDLKDLFKNMQDAKDLAAFKLVK